MTNTKGPEQQRACHAEGMEEGQGREMKSGRAVMRENGGHDECHPEKQCGAFLTEAEGLSVGEVLCWLL